MSCEDFVVRGYMAGCGGCVALYRNPEMSWNHTEICRARMEAQMEKSTEGRERKAKSTERIDDQLTRKFEVEDGRIQSEEVAKPRAATFDGRSSPRGG